MPSNKTRTCKFGNDSASEFRTAAPRAPRPAPGWPADAVETLVRLWSQGRTAAEVAARLGKTARAVECKIYKLRAAGRALAERRPPDGPRAARRAAQRARRRCLYCDSMFLSDHPGNRLCLACLEDGPFTSAMV